jgi:universal stress protein A
MALYRRILVALDLSDENRAVLAKAEQLARLCEARLDLVHVVEFPTLGYTAEFPVPEEIELERRMEEMARARLDKLAAGLGLDGVKAHVRIGVPKHEIRALADELDADLVLVGSHGRHGLQLLLGSTANGVLHLAGRDVLAVRIGT